ncbi:hypothetical protein CFAM422_010741 [Trichoderma lentiforme]|uniref:Uncharacterized protein n=1 Tax=Trichoderma lentiforme TaxID=1567552 RepID=A0A9P5CA77_9HYPO|nr:hypothetical protein CFAM422_010741 [Trichoderma lentiforme]
MSQGNRVTQRSQLQEFVMARIQCKISDHLEGTTSHKSQNQEDTMQLKQVAYSTLTSNSNNDERLSRKYGKDHRAQDRSQQNLINTIV